MLQVLQGQVEAIRSVATKQTDDTSGVYSTTPAYFCMDVANPTGPTREDFSGSLPAIDSDTFDSSVYNSKCLNIQNRYNVAITYDSATKVFSLTGRWISIGGGNSQEQLKYRIYPGIPVTSIPVGPTGDAAFSPKLGSGTPCTVDPITGYCSNMYHFYRIFNNNSNNTAGTVVGCEWDFGDGSPKQTTACNDGDTIDHFFPDTTTLPFPLDFGKDSYTVILTVFLNNGLKPTSTKDIKIPICY